MADLIYSNLASLDGYIADGDGRFDWAEPDAEVHTFVNDLMRPAGTHLYGRRLYEVMSVWQDPELAAGQPPHIAEFAEIWQAADKVVYSRTLEEATTPKTTIEREFDPEAVQRMKESAESDLAIGGPNLASNAFRAGLVDELQLFLAPIIVGAGNYGLPADVRLELELLDERRFANGMVFVRYRARR